MLNFQAYMDVRFRFVGGDILLPKLDISYLFKYIKSLRHNATTNDILIVSIFLHIIFSKFGI
uniref:Uncharacterized protein n=1 Tax=Meloidogyne enterolobii TaxID=390850 RepID=A0A6V7WQ59_MELEN|nr:unnamed protein product [Meloidogyne enterolobii]